MYRYWCTAPDVQQIWIDILSNTLYQCPVSWLWFAVPHVWPIFQGEVGLFREIQINTLYQNPSLLAPCEGNHWWSLAHPNVERKIAMFSKLEIRSLDKLLVAIIISLVHSSSTKLILSRKYQSWAKCWARWSIYLIFYLIVSTFQIRIKTEPDITNAIRCLWRNRGSPTNKKQQHNCICFRQWFWW